jgi:hypothetical protein
MPELGMALFRLNSTKSGVTLQLLPDDPLGRPDLSLLHEHRHPGDDDTEDNIICKSQEPTQARL